MEAQLEAQQDKSMERESQLREAAKLDKQAKVHLEGSFRNQVVFQFRCCGTLS